MTEQPNPQERREARTHRQRVAEVEAERDRLDEKLREMSARCRILLDTSPLGVEEIDTEGNIVEANRAYHEMLGYADGELIGKNVREIAAEGVRERVLADIKRIAVEQPAPTPYITQDVTKDGRRIDCEVMWNYQRDGEGKVVGFLSVVTDVTQRAQVAEELLRIRKAVDGASDAIGITDAEERTAYVNASFVRQFGYTLQELRAAPGTLRIFETPDVYAGIAGILKQGRSWSGEVNIHAKDGRNVPMLLRADPVIDDQGKFLGLLGTFTDITQRKHDEESVRREQQFLRQLLTLQERERKIIAYEIHDGLAQLLAGASLQLQAFRQTLTRAPEAAWRTFDVALNLLAQGVAESRSLISGLRPPVLDEAGIVAAVDYLISENRERGGPEVEFQHQIRAERLAPALETTVFRIVQEAINNARRHSRSPKVRLQLLQQEDSLHIEVQDWGVGFVPSEIEESRFGLEGIRERARLLEGQAIIDSAPNQGTRLIVELPLAARRQTEPQN